MLFLPKAMDYDSDSSEVQRCNTFDLHSILKLEQLPSVPDSIDEIVVPECSEWGEILDWG